MNNRPIYIIDDDSAVRESLSFLLETHGYTPHLYETGDDYLAKSLNSTQGPVLLDVRMPGRNGLDVLKIAMKQNPNLQIIMISGHGDIAMAVRALKMGAIDFIEKPFQAENILDVIEKASENASRKIEVSKRQREARVSISKLTPRQTEIFSLLVDGSPNKIIAHKLDISVRTVETHRAHIMTKLSISSLSDLVKLSLYAA